MPTNNVIFSRIKGFTKMINIQSGIIIYFGNYISISIENDNFIHFTVANNRFFIDNLSKDQRRSQTVDFLNLVDKLGTSTPEEYVELLIITGILESSIFITEESSNSFSVINNLLSGLNTPNTYAGIVVRAKSGTEQVALKRFLIDVLAQTNDDFILKIATRATFSSSLNFVNVNPLSGLEVAIAGENSNPLLITVTGFTPPFGRYTMQVLGIKNSSIQSSVLSETILPELIEVAICIEPLTNNLAVNVSGNWNE